MTTRHVLAVLLSLAAVCGCDSSVPATGEKSDGPPAPPATASDRVRASTADELMSELQRLERGASEGASAEFAEAYKTLLLQCLVEHQYEPKAANAKAVQTMNGKTAAQIIADYQALGPEKVAAIKAQAAKNMKRAAKLGQ